MPDKRTMDDAERAARWERRFIHAGRVMDRAEFAENAQGVSLDAVRLRLPPQPHGETMVVLTGRQDGVAVVGFYRAIGVSDALAGAMAKLHNGDIKWREDEYAKKGGQ